MASPPRLTRWLTRGWQAGLVAALVAAVAGCVGMPNSGTVAAGADQQNTAPAQQYVGPFVSGPEPTWTPRQIVQGFLDASANYPADAAIAKEYLVSSASNWDPGWSVQVFNKLTVFSKSQSSSAGRPGRQHAQVDVTGTLLAAFNSSGSGQYVSALGQGPSPSSYQFNLVKVDGLWRISNPPGHYRLLAAADFPRVYKAQDLYFFDSQDQGNPLDQVLVPYSVFVPLGTSPEDLVTHLVQDLTQDPSTTWLQSAAVTALPDSPGKTTVLNVSIEGATATVNLGGAATGASKPVLRQISAQLVWTIAGSIASPSAIQSIELEINGKPQTLPAPCGAGQSQSTVQKLAAYECYDPYPAAPASFYYAASGLAWSRCGPEAQAGAGHIGPVVPLVGKVDFLRSQQCGSDGYVPARGPAAAPPAQPRSLPAMSMAAVSPDGKYLALIPPGRDTVYVGPLSGPAASFSKTPRLPSGPVTALSWDRDDDLWVAQGGTIAVMPADGKTEATINQGEYVTGLSVAPDGVRIALIVRHGPRQSELQLGAISRPQSAAGEPKSPWQAPSIAQSVQQLGPGLTYPDALTWYDADDLVVLNKTNSGNTLWEVPVDAQQASPLGVLPPGTVSITADGAANALVAGLPDGQLAISAGLYGPWQTLTGNGQNPVYPGLRSWVIGDEMGTEPRPQRYAAVM